VVLSLKTRATLPYQNFRLQNFVGRWMWRD